MAAFMGRHDDWLDRHAADWVREGFVSADQAEAIRDFEHHHTEPSARLTIGAEVASYLGSVLALMGGAFVVGRRWDELGYSGRMTLAVAIALVGFAAGAWLLRVGEAGTSRLGGFMWVIGVGGVAMAAALTTDRHVTGDDGWIAVYTGSVVLALGLALWRNRDRPLQFLTAAAGFGVLTGGIGELLDPPTWVFSAVFMTSGVIVAWLALGAGLVPRELAVATGAFAAFVGALALTDVDRHLGPVTGLVVAAALVVTALLERHVPLLVMGVIGTLIATQTLLTTTFDGAIASMIVAIIGLALVLGAVLRTLGHTRVDGTPDA